MDTDDGTNWLLYQLTNSLVQLGLNGIFRAIPAITLGLISVNLLPIATIAAA